MSLLVDGFVRLVESFKHFQVAHMPKDKILRDFPYMTTPQSCEGFQGVLELAAIEKVVIQQFKSFDRHKWSILGWHTVNSQNAQMLIVLERLGSA